MEKVYVSANDLHRDALVLGKKVIESRPRPDVVVSVMRGGGLIGATVHELLRYAGIPADHLSIQAATYSAPDILHEGISIQGLDHVAMAGHGRNVLFVDDVFDRGMTYQKILDDLSGLGSEPSEVGLAVVFYKPARNRTKLGPDFYVKTTDKWLIFPHDLVGLSEEEIANSKGDELARIISSIRP